MGKKKKKQASALARQTPKRLKTMAAQLGRVIQRYNSVTRAYNKLRSSAGTPTRTTGGTRRTLVVVKSGDKPMSARDAVEGARDPFEGEISTGFGEKVLGNPDTEHVIKPPDNIKDLVGLSSKRCIPCEGKDVKAMTEEEAELMKKQAVGCKLFKDADENLRLKYDYKFKNFVKSLEFFQRVAAIAEAEGHHPDLHLVGWNNVTVELWTHSVSGLTENDFIMASKINEIDTSDLKSKKKQKFWA